MKDNIVEKGIESGIEKLTTLKESLNGSSHGGGMKSLVHSVDKVSYSQAISDFFNLMINTKTAKKMKQRLENADYKEIALTATKIAVPVFLMAGAYYLYSRSNREDSKSLDESC